MSDFMQGLTKTIDEHMKMLCHLRKREAAEVLRAMQQSYRESLSTSTDTQMESYWRAALEIVDRRIQAESGFASIGARETYR